MTAPGVYEWLQQRVVVLVEQQQVRRQTEVAAERLPLTRTCNYTQRQTAGAAGFCWALLVLEMQLPSRSVGGAEEFR